MKFKIIASVIVLGIVILALIIRSGSHQSQSYDENGNPVDNSAVQSDDGNN